VPSLSFHVPVAIILLGGGLLACFLGYRLLRVLLALYGFIGGVMIATLFLDGFETWVSVLVTVGSGLLGSLVAIAAYLAGVALAGAGLAAFVVNTVWERLEGEPILWVVLGACLVGALLALSLRRYVIIVGTSFGGAWTAIVGGLALTGNGAAVAAATGDVSQMYPLVPAGGHMPFVVGWLALGGVAALVQLRTLTGVQARRAERNRAD
jgi:hypothetical protein